jgi:hypothetical protein
MSRHRTLAVVIHDKAKTAALTQFVDAHGFAWGIYRHAATQDLTEKFPEMTRDDVSGRARRQAIADLKEDFPGEWQARLHENTDRLKREMNYPQFG